MPPKPKNTGLAAFTEEPDPNTQDAPPKTYGRGQVKAGSGPRHITIRLTPDQWEKAHQFARSEGIPVSQLAIKGISRLLKDKGLPEL
jgi:transposase InsO family protein